MREGSQNVKLRLSLTSSFEQEDAGGDRDIQAFRAAVHRDCDCVIGLHQFFESEAGRLWSKKQRSRAAPIKRGVSHRPANVSTNSYDSAKLTPFDRRHV